MKRREELVTKGMNEITTDNWLIFSQHVAKLEQQSWDNDNGRKVE
jgi:hypothetical protein